MEDLQSRFVGALQTNQKEFGISLDEKSLEKLFLYYQIVLKHNEILHLVAPCSPEEFAVRHVLESLALLEFLPENARFADVGAGAGLPSVPCLLARGDLRGALVESKLKKAAFLREVSTQCGLERRAEIINRQFEEVAKPDVSFVLCRALDKFSEKLPKLLKWSEKSSLLFFGGDNLRDALKKQVVKFDEKLMPMTERRFLFIARK